MISLPWFLGAGHSEWSPKSYAVSFSLSVTVASAMMVLLLKRKPATYSLCSFFPGTVLMATLQGPHPNLRLERLGEGR